MSAPRVTPGRLLSLLAIVFLPLCHDSLRAEQVVLSRLMPAPAQAKPEYIEFYNNTSNPFDIAKWRLSEGVTFEFAEFSPQQPAATFLHPFERIVLTGAAPAAARQAYAIPETVRVFGPWDGQLKDQGERVTLRDKNGGVVCTVKYGGAHWPDLTAGQPLVLIDPNQSIDDWRNWTVGQANTRPGTAPVPQTVSPAPSPEMEAGTGVILVDYASAWRFNDSGQPGSAQWTQPRFDDSQWRQGLGLLAFDQKPLPKPGLRTRVNMRGQTAFYFRTAFQVPAKPTAGSRLLVDQIVDDGAVYYLNGKEVARSRMPTGRILAATLASSTVPTAAEEMSAITLDSSLLNSGTNVLAVEVHQSSPNSSDIVFGARLRLTQPVQPGLVINEVFAEAQNGFVEFCNNASQPLNLKGCFLSDTADQFQKYSFREDVVVAAGGLTSVSLAESGLAIANPLTVYFTDKDGHTLLSAVTVSFAEDGRSIGRRPQGGSTWFRFPSPSRNQPNQGAEGPAGQPAKEASSGKPAPVVINEIMYDPPYHAEGTEFVELFNRSPNQVDLSRWRFTDGIEFTFPAGTSLAANSYAVVAADQERLGQHHPGIPALGNYKGRLRHGGELLRLVDAAGELVDQVDFRAGGDWPLLAHGDGSSLELIHPDMDRSQSSAWAASREAEKAAWRTYACTNTYLELNPIGQPSDYRELHLYLVTEGHVALRNIGLWRNGANFVENAGHMSTNGSSATGWLAQGTHAGTYLTNGELHLVADGRGDVRADRVEIDCPRLRRGQQYELRFEAKWVSGCPRLIAHTWDRSVGSSFLLPLPAALGTPGRPNSVTLLPTSGPGPQLERLRHAPAVPRSTDTVTVTAQVINPKAGAQVLLFHRLDTPTGDAAWKSKPMSPAPPQPNSGPGQTYRAELTEYGTNGVVGQFFVEVTSQGQVVRLPRHAPERPALFVVDDRKIPRDARLDRFVVSSYDLGSMRDGNTARYGFRHPKLSNHRYNMTFISNEETVFYSGSIRVSGSPFTRGRDLGKGKWELPADRPFRGRTKFYFDNDSNYHNRLCRYFLYLLGHPTGEAEWVRVIINNSGAYLREDTEPVTGEFVDRIFPNGRHGELYRFDDEWWFADDWDKNNRDADWSYKGSDDPRLYRTEWQKRTREIEDDYSALIAFFKTYSSSQYSKDEMEQRLDPIAVLQMAAVRGYIGDWDSFTMFRGKNGYFYRRPTDGKFQFFQWDSDLAFRPGNYPFYTDRVAPWLERPENMAIFKAYLEQLAQLSQSPRLAAWFEEESAAKPTRTVNAAFYQNFFKQRNRFLQGR